MATIRVYTDGACSKNPGPGGWAAIFCNPEESESISGCDVETTNNRMELTAVNETFKKIANAEYADFTRFEIHSDSAYVVNSINKYWLDGWAKRGWKTSTGDDVKNIDLWKICLKLMKRIKHTANVEAVLIKVKGHSGNTFNEMADQLAVQESMKAKAKLKDGESWV